ncbi:MAG: chorismate synthase [Firmicutes bacterium]|nr:chorismate synthase [Bacillota bacterium]MCL1953772.1 chorismate synthase [Bacillota bacterium]
MSAGESHGEALVAIIDGFPRGLRVNIDDINRELYIRQTTYGRGERSKIEQDKVHFVSGLRGGVTTGNPISFLIPNKDYWKDSLDCCDGDIRLKSVYRPRPGHADFAGVQKYGISDARDILERASARDTATRCVVGSICCQLLAQVGILLYGIILQIGNAKIDIDFGNLDTSKSTDIYGINDSNFATRVVQEIDSAKKNKDTVGGKIAIIAKGMPIGVGSYTSYDTKLTYHISAALASLQTVKSVEFGDISNLIGSRGSNFQDCIYYDDFGDIRHASNNAGGITGGVSNGQDIIVRCGLKPIPTILKGMQTIDFATMTNEKNIYQRSDICHVPAACLVAKNILAFVLAQQLISHTGAVTVEQFSERLGRKNNI